MQKKDFGEYEYKSIIYFVISFKKIYLKFMDSHKYKLFIFDLLPILIIESKNLVDIFKIWLLEYNFISKTYKID